MLLTKSGSTHRFPLHLVTWLKRRVVVSTEIIRLACCTSRHGWTRVVHKMLDTGREVGADRQPSGTPTRLWGKPTNGVFMFDIWILLSAFGIMFAILSWCQESSLLPKNMRWKKGALALAIGVVLYLLFVPFLR